jgi:hypothetical protein
MEHSDAMSHGLGPWGRATADHQYPGLLPPTSPSSVRTMLALVRRSLDTRCRRAHEHAFESVSDGNGAGTSDNKSMELAVYLSLRKFKKSELTIRHQFCEAVLARFDASPVGPGIPQTACSLELMSDDEVEWDVLCSALTAKTGDDTAGLLTALRDALVADGHHSLAARAEEAFNLRLVLRTYMQVAGASDAHPELRAILAQCLTQEIAEELPILLRECTIAIGAKAAEPQRLARPSVAAFTPAITSDAVAVSDAARPAHFDTALGSNQPGAAPGPAVGARVLGAVLDLLAGRNRGSVPASARTWSRGELQEALASLQKSIRTDSDRSATGDGAEPLIEVLESWLLSWHGRPGGEIKVMSEVDRAFVDLIEMLFDFLVGDPELPAALRKELLRLRVPYLRLTLIDRQLLIHGQSPARQLLESMVRTAVEYGQGAPFTFDVQRECTSVIDEVLNRFDGSPEVFPVIFATFNRQRERAAAQVQRTERRTVDAVEHRERLHVAWAHVCAIIAPLIDMAGMPAIVDELLARPLAQYLVLLRLKGHADTPAWQSGVAIAERLVTAFRDWSASQQRTHEQIRKSVRVLCEVATELRTALQRVGYDADDVVVVWRALLDRVAAEPGAHARPTSEVIKRIGQDVRVAMREYAIVLSPSAVPGDSEFGLPPVPASLSEAASVPVQTASSNVVPLAAPDPQALADKHAPVAIGDWLEWRRTEEPPLRVKLCWRGTASRMLVFVNQAGCKVLEASESRVAGMLDDGTLHLSQREAVVEHALLGVLSRLRH